MLGALRATANGVARLIRVKRLVLWLWLANVLFALPLAVVVSDAIGQSIRASRVGETLLEGLDLVWHAEYAAATDGVGGTLEPSQVGIGAFLDNLELSFLLEHAFHGSGRSRGRGETPPPRAAGDPWGNSPL